MVGGAHESQHILLRGLAQSTGLLSQLIEPLSGCAGIHLFKLLIERCHLLLGHTCKLAHVGLLLVHLRVLVDPSAHCCNCLVGAQSHGGDRRAALVDKSGEFIPAGFLEFQLAAHFFQLLFHLLNLLYVRVPHLGALRHILQLLVEQAESLFKLARRGFVQTAQHLPHPLGSRLDFIHLLLILLQLILCLLYILRIGHLLLHRSDGVLGLVDFRLQIGHHLLSLRTVNV